MKNKVVLVSPFNSSFTYPVFKAFIKLGFQTILYDYKYLFGNLKFNFSNNIILYLKSIYKITSNMKRISFLNKNLVEVCRKFKPKYLFVIKGETIDTITIKTINNLGIVSILWQVDPTFHPDIWKYVKKVGRQYKYYISCEPDVEIMKLKKLGFKNVLYMLGAADESNFLPVLNNNKIYDISLIGTYHPEREKYLSFLSKFDLHIWGWGKWKNSKLKKFYEGYPVSQQKMLKIYSQSKIVIDINRNPTSSIPTNIRPFEAAQAGTFIITKYHKNLHKIFKINKEIITFNNKNDLILKVKYYLFNEKERLLIAKNMQNRILQDHTYIKRLNKLFHQIN